MITNLEKQLADNDIKKVTEEDLNGDVGFFVRRILEGLGAIDTPQSVMAQAIQTGTIATGTHKEVTLDFLQGLPDKYFGSTVNLAHERYGLVYFSLEKHGGEIYAQVHISREEFEAL